MVFSRQVCWGREMWFGIFWSKRVVCGPATSDHVLEMQITLNETLWGLDPTTGSEFQQTLQILLSEKRNALLANTMAWMNFKNMMLSEKGQTQEATYSMIPFIDHVQKRQIFLTESRWAVLGGWEWKWELIVSGHEGLYWGNTNVLKLIYGAIQ